MRLAPVESAERQLIGQCAARIVTAASKDRSPLQVLDQAVDSFRSPTGKPPRLISDLHSALVIGGNYTRELDPKHIQGAVFSAFKGAHPEILAQLPRKIRIALRVKRPLIQFIEESSIQ